MFDGQVLHSEIKGKKEKVEDVQKDADTCAASIKVNAILSQPVILSTPSMWLSLKVSYQFEYHIST